MYSVHSHGLMIADRVRVEAYRRALQRVVHPGSVVVDIGTGTGIFALFACELGARRVFAIEAEEVIHVARQIARDNGYAGQIEFFHERSSRVDLPERADVIVADIHGTLPLFDASLETLIDARKRFLKPEGTFVPRRERIYVAVVELPATRYADEVQVWTDGRWGLNLSAGERFGVDHTFKVELSTDNLLTEPGLIAELDYSLIDNPVEVAPIILPVVREGTAHGYIFWFDSELAEGVSLSTAPERPATVYANTFAPWSRPVTVEPGDRITAEMAFRSAAGSDVWRWDTRVESAASDGVKADFRQSNFRSLFVSAERLKKRSPQYRPRLNKMGNVGRLLLESLNGERSNAELASLLRQQFPEILRSETEALQFVTDLAERYSD